MAKEILFNAFDMNCVGHQSCGLWRHPRDRSAEYTSMKYWQDLARTLERGLFDGIFLADVTGIYDVYNNSPDAALRSASQVPTNDPFTLVPVMAAVTEHLCFGVTGSIPYEPPYSFARRISSLDHLTEGRIGWNIVTGYLNSAAKGVGKAAQTAHDTRYDIAAEYMSLVYKLWEGSWEEGAVLRDKANGIFTDPGKVHRVSHDGEYFQLEAIHLCEPSPQRTPVLFQAGTSPKGQAFAASHAECVFISNTNRRHMADVVKSLREQTVLHGRNAEDIKVFAMMSVIVAETDDKAQAKLLDYTKYASHEGALALMSGWSGVDLSNYEPGDKVENISTQAIQSAMTSVGSKSINEWAEFLAVGGAAPLVVGSPKKVADELQQWVSETGIDGFNLAYTVMPECLEHFVDLVVPELQRRGVYKTQYSDGTMREKLFEKGPRLQYPHPATGYRHG